MITVWLRLDKRPRHLSLGRWDSTAETPAEVKSRYEREPGPPLLLWSTGELSGGLQGERRLAWPTADFPLGVISARTGKGDGVLLLARSRERSERTIALLACDRFDSVVLDWMIEHRKLIAPLFPAGVIVEPTDEATA